MQDLLVQPAKYEPFGSTVAEALASGVPVVVTTEVGAGEDVAAMCCMQVEIEDPDELERAVREMIARVRSSEARSIRETARQEAERFWTPKRVGEMIEEGLQQVAKGSRSGPQPSSDQMRKAN
jgi:glycosyltransferase involved in cell wall biosynthesis